MEINSIRFKIMRYDVVAEYDPLKDRVAVSVERLTYNGVPIRTFVPGTIEMSSVGYERLHDGAMRLVDLIELDRKATFNRLETVEDAWNALHALNDASYNAITCALPDNKITAIKEFRGACNAELGHYPGLKLAKDFVCNHLTPTLYPEESIDVEH